MRFRFVFVLLAAAAAWAPEAQAQTALKARFIGNASFEITDGTTTLLTDFPYKSGAFGYMTYPIDSVQPTGDVLCLITHHHADHWDKDLFLPTRWSVAGPRSVTGGLDQQRVVALSPEGRFGSIMIRAIESRHAPEGHYSYLVTWHGQRLYFTGDTEVPDQLLAAGPVDTLFITPWLLRNSMKQGLKLPARRFVIYHHDAAEPLPTCAGCVGPRQGQELDLSAGAPAAR